jgi:hypothetical protein
MSKPHGERPLQSSTGDFRTPSHQTGIAPLRRIILLLAVLVCAPAQAAEHQGAYMLFPPADCSAKELRVVIWRNGDSTTRCASAQELLKRALPGCKAGQQVIYDGNAFSCKDAPPRGAK